MKKRIISFLMAMVMLFGISSVCITHVYAETEATTEATTVTEPEEATEPSKETEPEKETEPDTEEKPSEEGKYVTSDQCVAMLKAEEGFSEKPYWDYGQYTVGYGCACPPEKLDYYLEYGISEAEAEALLRKVLEIIEKDIIERVIEKYNLTLTQHQFDALVMFSYNCGTSWTYDPSGTFHQVIATGATGSELIRGFALWCSAGDQIQTFLLRRRLFEANMYLNGIYDKNPPENYTYVLYDANGGTTSPRSQGYDTNLKPKPYPVPKMNGYVFQGWFTEKKGGTKITVLDETTREKTLFAQWADADGNPPPEHGATENKKVTVTVTAWGVNLRKGPGTNHTVLGQADMGQKLVITETASGTGYLWGKFDGGWIALLYTDYEEALNTQPEPTDPEPTEPEPTEPEPTEPEPTEPEPTEPKPTEPEPTEPKPTEPEPTEPEPTEPEPTEPEKEKITGTVDVQDWLRIRGGPGTEYSIEGYLQPRERVEILELKMVGTQQWGKISRGWISMEYVILDKTSSDNENNDDNTTGTVWKGKVVNAIELRIRSGPGTDYSIVGYLKDGTEVTVTEKKNNGITMWGKISNGWICLDYVEFESNSDDATKPESITGTVRVNEFLRVRNGPGTSYSVAGYLKPDERLTITERRTVDGVVWGKISQGWISLEYVELDEDAGSSEQKPVQPAKKTIIADCLNVRAGAGTFNDVVGYLYYGDQVEVSETVTISDGTVWGKISAGWICMDYAK